MSQLTLQSVGNDAIHLEKQTIQDLDQRLRGPLLQPDGNRYDEARTIYNAMIDRRPGLIARCADVADVVHAVRFASEHDMLVSVRSGGHNMPGLALCDGGLTIDLSDLKGIRVDPEARTARVEAGCRWGDVDHATHPFGLATVSGVISTTGVGGLTLGGGHGYLTRKYGLTIDNLRSADVVLADGSLVQTSEGQHPDLFWALRGGGGNFGVVTAFEYVLHPVDSVIGGPMFWPLDRMESVLRWYRDYLPQAPDDVYAFFLTGEVPASDHFPEAIHGRKICGLVWCLTSDDAEVTAALEQAREVAPPLFEHVGPMPYPELQSAFDALYPPGLHWYWKGDFVRELSDEAIAEHARFAEVPTPLSIMHLYPIDGAVHRVAADATAWRHRDAVWSMVIAGVASNPSAHEKEAIMRWPKDYWEAVHPHCVNAAYINFMMEEGRDRIRASYGDNYERLAATKRRYDPRNLFRVNQNIEPAS